MNESQLSFKKKKFYCNKGKIQEAKENERKRRVKNETFNGF